jgi:hypothetical protein
MTGVFGPVLRPLERVIIDTALGIRFWDGARDVPIRNGLLVHARLPGAVTRLDRATPTRSGVYAFHALPGLRAQEHPSSGSDGSLSPPTTRRYIVDVVDTLGRFVPVAFGVDAPHRGIYPTDGVVPSPPGEAAPGFFLFPAVTASAPSSMAVVRAEVREHATDEPAAHAVLQVTLPGGRRQYGIADGAGRVAAIFPHPRFAPTVLSPPPTADDAREPASWAVSVRVRYHRPSQVATASGLPPDMESLFGQPPAAIWATTAGPPATELGVTLVLGQETVLRTDGEPRLLVG